MKILFTGGGTAGHIYPIVNIVREIYRMRPEEKISFFYLGPKDNFIANILENENVEVKTILAGKIRRYFSFQNFVDILKIPIGFIQAFLGIFSIAPDVIFSKGGYGSFPVILAGWVLRVPIFLHESDATPGLANRIAAIFTTEIFTAFPIEKVDFLPKDKIVSVGNPIRRELFLGKAEEGKKIFSLTGERPVLFFMGGSQGAQRINEVLLLILPRLLGEYEVIHQTGADNISQIENEMRIIVPQETRQYYHPVGFLKEWEMACAYRAVDLIISRAGAGSIFEIAAMAKPSILIPLADAAQNHQVKNAYAFAETGAAIVIEEANFTPNFFIERLDNLFSHPEKLKEMGLKAKEFAKPEAGRLIAEYLVEYLFQ